MDFENVHVNRNLELFFLVGYSNNINQNDKKRKLIQKSLRNLIIIYNYLATNKTVLHTWKIYEQKK